MTRYTSRLAAKVAAQNRVNAEANRLVPLILEALKPLLEQKTKVLLADGGWTAKFKAARPELPNYTTGDRNMNFMLTSGHGYHLTLEGKATEYYKFGESIHDHGQQQAETTVYLAHLSGQVLESFFDITPLRTDYTCEEVMAARKELETAKGLVSAAQAKLFYFGEYDR